MRKELMEKGCRFGGDRKYRYVLWRIWDMSRGRVLFIGCNPSVADENKEDPTTKRCMGFAARWGYGGIYICNVKPIVERDQYIARQHREPIGVILENLVTVNAYIPHSQKIVVCWGNFKPPLSGILPLLEESKREIYCLGKNKDGSPRHPLYISYDSDLVFYFNKTERSSL